MRAWPALAAVVVGGDEWWMPLPTKRRRSCALPGGVLLPEYVDGALDVLAGTRLPEWARGRRRSLGRPLGPASSNCSSMINRAAADLGPLHRALRGAAAGRSLDVVVLGGSMTAGHMPAAPSVSTSACEALPEFPEGGYGYNRDNRACAFPRRLEGWLRAAYPKAAVRVANLGVGGSTSRSIVGSLSSTLASHPMDVAVVNYATNDNAHRERTGAGFDVLLRLLRARRAAVVVLELPPFPLGGAAAFAPHLATAQSLAVPVFSWAAATPANFERHPPWPIHQLVADWLAHNLRLEAAFAAAAPDPGAVAAEQAAAPPREAFVAADVVCSRPLSTFDASSARSVPGVTARGWRLAEDAPDKRGWVATDRNVLDGTGPRPTITFAANATDVFGVGFLAARDVGRVAVFLGANRSNAVVLDARRPRANASLTEYARLCADGDDNADFPRCAAIVESPFVPPPARAGRARRREVDLELEGLAAPTIKDKYAAEDRLKRLRAPPNVRYWRWRDPNVARRDVSFELLPGEPGEETRFVLRYLTTC